MCLPAGSDIERRDRAIIAFTLLSGARDSAIASMCLKHVDVGRRRISQDPRDGVQTKNAKTIITTFFPVGAGRRGDRVGVDRLPAKPNVCGVLTIPVPGREGGGGRERTL